MSGRNSKKENGEDKSMSAKLRTAVVQGMIEIFDQLTVYDNNND